MIKIILFILLTISLAFAQPGPFEKKVEDGRKAMEKYREYHAKMYDNNGMKYDHHGKLLGKLYSDLEKAGYIQELPFERLDAFSYDNRTYNVQRLGFENLEDFRWNATPQNVTDYLNMWK